MTKNDVNLDEVVCENWKLPGKMFDTEWTKSTLFLLPMVKIDLNKRTDLVKHFENAFVKDCQYDEDFLRPLFILVSTTSFATNSFLSTQAFMRSNSNYCSEYDLGMCENKNLIMYVLQIPPEFKDDYYHFKSGAYSKMSDKVKALYNQKIIDKNLVLVKNVAYHAANKTDEMQTFIMKEFGLDEEFTARLDEWWDGPSREREYYRYEPRRII